MLPLIINISILVLPPRLCPMSLCFRDQHSGRRSWLWREEVVIVLCHRIRVGCRFLPVFPGCPPLPITPVLFYSVALLPFTPIPTCKVTGVWSATTHQTSSHHRWNNDMLDSYVWRTSGTGSTALFPTWYLIWMNCTFCSLWTCPAVKWHFWKPLVCTGLLRIWLVIIFKYMPAA